MFKKILTMGEVYEKYMTKRARIEAHRILMSLSDRALADVGVNRHELEGGVKNWPWDGSVAATNATTANIKLSENQAIRELSAYSDRELHDIGINRGMIADAVKNGRDGIENVAEVASATSNDLKVA